MFKLRQIGHAALIAGAFTLTACSSDGDLDLTSGVGVRATLDGCPIVGVPNGTGDITLFNGDGRASTDIDVAAAITNVRSTCTDTGGRYFSQITFDVVGTRSNAGPARSVQLPFYSVMVQGGTNVRAKQVGNVTLTFGQGQNRAQTSATAGAYVDASLTALPPEVREAITRQRKPGDVDAAVDPLSDPTVRAAVASATYEHLLGFQLTDEQLGYNVTR